MPEHSPYEEFLKSLVASQLIERYEMTGEDAAIVKIKHPVNWVPSIVQWQEHPEGMRGEDFAARLGGQLGVVHGRPPIRSTPPCSECKGSGHTTEYGVYQLCPTCGGNGLGDRPQPDDGYCCCQFPEGYTTNARCCHCNKLIRSAP